MSLQRFKREKLLDKIEKKEEEKINLSDNLSNKSDKLNNQNSKVVKIKKRLKDE